MKRKINQLKTYTGRFTLIRKQQGSTLIEVLVSMLMLGLGVLVLLATQLKTVAGVREAENQTIVAQATQNLIEGMLANPKLKLTKLNTANISGGIEWNSKNYDIYSGNINSVNPDSCTGLTSKNDLNKTNLALEQMCDFRKALKTNLPDATFHINICRDSSNQKPTVSSGGNVDWHCVATTKDTPYTVVKILWQMDTENEENAKGVTVVDGKAVYTYQARVTD
ncbi:MAG: type IV pilus modification protein PilV [Neisseria sp.]|uniref:type IV pilus modification protein PilV n=1 Tax=Neisseria sp. TaxID=192066 RepID=UPI0026DBF160|nr:type IV pilus modification protein PilV [Neisseria sp.]MDO4640197.1 type IV pilus modification protein PilV [Neisseria sp.]